MNLEVGRALRARRAPCCGWLSQTARSERAPYLCCTVQGFDIYKHAAQLGLKHFHWGMRKQGGSLRAL